MGSEFVCELGSYKLHSVLAMPMVGSKDLLGTFVWGDLVVGMACKLVLART
jgi:hypothetical protein